MITDGDLQKVSKVSEVEFRFLTLEDVLELHDMQIESYGGAIGIRAPDLLESAVMMPQASFGGQYVHIAIVNAALTVGRPTKL